MFYYYLFSLGGIGSLFQKHIYQLLVSKVTLLVFVFPNLLPKKPHQRRVHFEPIKLQDAHLTDLTETLPKGGDWVGKKL